MDSVRRPLTLVPVAFSFVLEKSDCVLTSWFKAASCHFVQLLAALVQYMNVVKADSEKL